MSYFSKWNNRALSTTETNLIKYIQRKENAVEDGLFGTQTLASIVRSYDDAPYPFSLQIFNTNLIFSDKILPILTKNKSSCGKIENSISGTFQYKNVTSSMFCADGEWTRQSSTHDWLGNPESVLYITNDGKVNSSRVLYASQIIEYKNIKHAIGGLGLHNYDPKIEGFTGAYSDVLRRTNHTAIGWDGKSFVGVYCSNMTGGEIRTLMIDKLKCKYAILLDGGHIASANIDGLKANISQLQNNIIQFI